MDRRTLIIAGVLVLMSLATGMANAQAVKIPYTGTDVFDTTVSPPVGGMDPSGATFLCPGGEVIGPFFCTPGSRELVVRGVKVTERTIIEGPYSELGTGWSVITVNENLALPSYTGRSWGTFVITLDAGEDNVWEGIWTGVKTYSEESGWTELIRGVGFGRGTLVEGMQVRFTVTNSLGFSPLPAKFTGQVSGEVLQPPPSQ